jgi:outer membrane protein OmpA-like peptidoglycan-associated protein
MSPQTASVFLAFVLLFASQTIGDAGTQDIAGAKDHPWFGRMQNFAISEYEVKDFDRHEFKDSGGNDVVVEGRKTVIQYEIRQGAKTPSPLQITRNFVNAVKKIGGSTFEYTEGTAFLSLIKDGKEAWAEVTATGEAYTLTVVEKAALVQEVTANALLEALNRDGRVTLYIHFDTGKATIKPESQPVIAQIVEMLRSTPDLAIGVEGHTDNVGTAPANKTLSNQRAAAVVAAIVKQGVEAKRLSASGFGQEKPIADNKTEEGRAKNRRVELVKR